PGPTSGPMPRRAASSRSAAGPVPRGWGRSRVTSAATGRPAATTPSRPCSPTPSVSRSCANASPRTTRATPTTTTITTTTTGSPPPRGQASGAHHAGRLPPVTASTEHPARPDAPAPGADVPDTVDRAAETPDEQLPYAELGLKPDEYARIVEILGRR